VPGSEGSNKQFAADNSPVSVTKFASRKGHPGRPFCSATPDLTRPLQRCGGCGGQPTMS
jgi:hypothetical protein